MQVAPEVIIDAERLTDLRQTGKPTTCPVEFCGGRMIYKGTRPGCVWGTSPGSTDFTVDVYECEDETCGAEVYD